MSYGSARMVDAKTSFWQLACGRCTQSKASSPLEALNPLKAVMPSHLAGEVGQVRLQHLHRLGRLASSMEQAGQRLGHLAVVWSCGLHLHRQGASVVGGMTYSGNSAKRLLPGHCLSLVGGPAPENCQSRTAPAPHCLLKPLPCRHTNWRRSTTQQYPTKPSLQQAHLLQPLNGLAVLFHVGIQHGTIVTGVQVLLVAPQDLERRTKGFSRADVVLHIEGVSGVRRAGPGCCFLRLTICS